MLVLHQWHGLSDFELWKQGIDRISFKKFLGVTEYIPDSPIVWLFRKKIINSCKEEEIEGQLQSQLDDLVFENKKGNYSGFYLNPFRFNMQKQVNLEKIKQKKDNQRPNISKKVESHTLDLNYIT